MIGKQILHYKIIEKLGEGGMGVVYKAEDTKLKRDVAIKFLPSRIAANDEERERFKIEAQAAAALNHPNIAHIYAIEEADEEMFIVMEYIDGQELKNIIKIPPIPPLGKGGTTSPFEGGARRAGDVLPIDDVINYATQIADGLQAAHEKGIVHRDIKSANIMITNKGRVKIMDFGLAKVRGGAQVTKVGTTIGTAAYMSPEQARSEEADHRSDIWSFGVVLYEMLSGRLPFGGEYGQAVIYSILNENPKPINEERPEIPLELQNIINHTLQKNPEERYQQVQDLLLDLKGLGTGSTESKSTMIPKANLSQGKVKKLNFLYYGIGLVILIAIVGYFLFSPTDLSNSEKSGTERKMLVVLPFENLGSPEQEYFADGVTEEVTNRLSGISGLGVIARSSAMQYKNTTKTLREIGNELGVGYILQGTVRWGTSAAGDMRVRVSPVLIKVSDATQLWSQPYDAVFSDVFKMQSEIATQVASALGITLLQPQRTALQSKATDNPEAYDFYLRGRDYYNRSDSQKDWAIAEQMYKKAIDLDPKFASAYADLSRLHSDIYWFYYDHSEDRSMMAKETAERALNLSSNNPLSHAAMGWYHYHCRLDYDNALKEFNIALELQPNNADILHGIAAVQRRQGKIEESIPNWLSAVEYDPRSVTTLSELDETYRLARKYSEAEQTVDRALALSPDWATLYIDKALTYVLWKGELTKARAIIEEATKRMLGKDEPELIYISLLFETYAANYQKALDQLAASNNEAFSSQFWYIPRELLIAQINGYLGNNNAERLYFDSSRVILEGKVREEPNDARFHSSLGICYAGLGRKENAIREGKRAVDLLPISKEAWRGAYRAYDLAIIYAMVGESEAAIDLLEKLLSIPSDFSPSLLRLDLVWNPLRNNPRFQKLIGGNT
jgi:serine/threonine protein kinase/tetratricopeptide (TPR) repeat protein